MTVQTASPGTEALDPVTTDLFASAPQELGFAPGLVVRSFLIHSNDGNLLLNASEGALRNADAIDAGRAAEFYAATFPESRVYRVNAAPADCPGARESDELTVEFTVLGRKFVGLNGGPIFTPNESVSFMVITEDQEETGRYWNAIIGNGGKESVCG